MKMTPYQSPIFAPKKFDAERKSAEKGCAEVGVSAEKNSSAKKRSPMGSEGGAEREKNEIRGPMGCGCGGRIRWPMAAEFDGRWRPKIRCGCCCCRRCRCCLVAEPTGP